MIELASPADLIWQLTVELRRGRSFAEDTERKASRIVSECTARSNQNDRDAFDRRFDEALRRPSNLVINSQRYCFSRGVVASACSFRVRAAAA